MISELILFIVNLLIKSKDIKKLNEYQVVKLNERTY